MKQIEKHSFKTFISNTSIQLIIRVFSPIIKQIQFYYPNASKNKNLEIIEKMFNRNFKY